jgi:hypothetical protein
MARLQLANHFGSEGKDMSLWARDESRRDLRDYLARALDINFLALIWAVDALQSGRVAEAAKYIAFPKGADTEEITAHLSIHSWELETLATVLLLGRKLEPTRLHPVVKCNHFGDLGKSINMLRKIENAEHAVHLDGNNIMLELHRIAQRQFAWQRGYVKPQSIYRFLYVYGQGKCADYFHGKYGISINDFSLCAFVIFQMTYEDRLIARPNATAIGIAPETMDAALAVLSLNLDDIRKRAKEIRLEAMKNNGGADLPKTAYQPSALRQYPVITIPIMENRIISPLPELVMYRATAGLFYDIVKGGQTLVNEANQRFEQYGRLLITTHLPRFEVLEAQKYKFNDSDAETPDILLKDGGVIVAAFECKATKLSFAAQYAENPMVSAKTAYDQMTKGIFQLWKFFSHARRGLYGAQPVSSTAHGILLTMETWFNAAGPLQTQATATAKTLASADPQITADDMRPIVFCAMDELEDVIGWATEDTFLTLLGRAAEAKFHGWSITSVQRDENLKNEEWNPFSLELKEVMPWWEVVEGLRD